MQHRWKTKAAAFLLALTVLFTGGMGQAVAAEKKQDQSILEECQKLPLSEALACLKNRVKDRVRGHVDVAEIRLLLLFIAQHEWHAESKKAFPDLYKESLKLQEVAKKVTSNLKIKVTEEDFKDPKLGAQWVAIQKETIKSLEDEFNLLYQPAVLSIQLVKAMAELLALLGPVVKDVGEFVSDPELGAALDKANSGFDQMNHALNGLNSDVDGMNKAMTQMNRGIDLANKGMDQMVKATDQAKSAIDQINDALAGMNKALDQVNTAMDQINEAINGANKGVEKANAGAAGMNGALDELNKALKGKLGDSPFKDLDLSGVADYVRGGPKANPDRLQQALSSLLMDFTAVIGDAQGIGELLTGEDQISGEKLSAADRALGAVFVLRWIRAGKRTIQAVDLRKAIKNEKGFQRVGNVRWGEGGGGKTVLGDPYKTPVTDDLRELVNPGGGKTNCRACVLGVERTLDGAPASALPKIGRGSITELEKYFPGKKFVNRSFSNIVKDVKSGGDGARGIVFGLDKRGGHVFNVINRDGDVVFLDAQSGHAAPTAYTNYQFMRTK